MIVSEPNRLGKYVPPQAVNNSRQEPEENKAILGNRQRDLLRACLHFITGSSGLSGSFVKANPGVSEFHVYP